MTIKEGKAAIPTPPVPPTTRTTLDEDGDEDEEGTEGIVWESWVDSEVEDSTNWSITAFETEKDCVDCAFVLKKYWEEGEFSGRRGNKRIAWACFGNVLMEFWRTDMWVSESLDAINVQREQRPTVRVRPIEKWEYFVVVVKFWMFWITNHTPQN